MNTPSTTISTPSSLASLLTALTSLPNPSAPLYLDLEGINLSRHGTIALLTLHTPALPHAYLIDIHTLGSLAFTTPCPLTGTTLASLLASPTPAKVFFDVRNDSDALFAHYGVRLRGVEDVQLMENAGRPTAVARRLVAGLERCIEMDLGGRLTWAERRAWRAAKEAGKKLFAPERGGRYEVFEERPVRGEVERYCVNDGMFPPSSLPWRLGAVADDGWVPSGAVADAEGVVSGQVERAVEGQGGGGDGEEGEGVAERWVQPVWQGEGVGTLGAGICVLMGSRVKGSLSNGVQKGGVVDIHGGKASNASEVC